MIPQMELNHLLNKNIQMNGKASLFGIGIESTLNGLH